jgi:hypothetical protein
MQSRIIPSIAVDITDAESFAYSVTSIMSEVIIGKIEDMGHASAVTQAMLIGADNDATLRIAHDAASAKRALHILRRVGHTRYLTDQGAIKGLKVDRELNLADVGTHYCSREVMAYFEAQLRGANM